MPESEIARTTVTIRPARVEELPALSRLCLRSKAVWGYDEAFIEACRAELTISPNELADSAIGVAVIGDDVVGIVQVRSAGVQADLEKIFVEPSRLGRGLGRTLFNWALEKARIAGAQLLVVAADPSAAPFYRTMGMSDAGYAPSGSIPGRLLPRLVMSIDA